MKQNPSIREVSFSNGIPGRVNNVLTVFQEGKNESLSHTFEVIFADRAFLETYGIRILEGRNFSESFTADAEGAFLINKKAAAKLGWEENTVGRKIGRRKVLGASVANIVLLLTQSFHALDFSGQFFCLAFGLFRSVDICRCGCGFAADRTFDSRISIHQDSTVQSGRFAVFGINIKESKPFVTNVRLSICIHHKYK
ncbi:MAG: hypothetical protein MUP98_08365 [Candidatus Aminicenantes bacterium]|nr:hypothetical protein [Candidatus Aminicenantes bacterium]